MLTSACGFVYFAYLKPEPMILKGFQYLSELDQLFYSKYLYVWVYM